MYGYSAKEGKMYGCDERGYGGGMNGGRGPSSQLDEWEGIFFLFKVKGQIYLFLWKLQ